MSILEAIISGIIQGVTEFLPISSSGHLVVLHTLFGYREPKVLEDVLLHFGTLLAIIIFFWKDIIDLCRDKRFLFLIVIGTVPLAVVGFFFGEELEPLFTNTKVVGIALLITGLWLLAANFSLRTLNSELRTTNLSIWHALLIGISQTIALVPGISRSGATISTGLLLKNKWDLCFQFSFLLSVPAVLGALFYKMGDVGKVDTTELGVMIGGVITACLVGIFALWLLKNILLKKRLYYFSVYCWVLGLILLFV